MSGFDPEQLAQPPVGVEPPPTEAPKKGIFGKKSKEPVGGVFVPKKDIVPGVGTGEEYKDTSRFRKRKDTEGTDHFHFDEKFLSHIGTFLESHLESLQRIPATLLDGPQHAGERALLQELGDGKGGIDKAKVQEFVRTSKGIEIAHRTMQLRTAAELFMLGLDISAVAGRGTEGLGQEMTVNVDRLAREFTGDWQYRRITGGFRNWGERRPDRGSGIGPGIALGAIGGITGAAIGAIDAVGGLSAAASLLKSAGALEWGLGGVLGGAAGGVTGALLGRRFLSHNGDIDIHACADGLTAMKNLPDTDRAYLKAVTGIDVDDFNVVGGGIAFARVPEHRQTRSMFELQARIRDRLDANREFYRVIGLPRPESRTVPENFFTHYNVDHEDQVATIWDEKILQLYDPVASAALPPEEQLSRFLDVQRQVLDQEIVSYMTEVKNKSFEDGRWVDNAEKISQLKTRINQGTEDQEKLRKRHVDRQAALNGDVGRLDTDLKVLTDFEEQQTRIDRADQEIIQKHREHISTTGIRSVAQLIDRYDEIINGAWDVDGTIENRFVQLEQERQDRLAAFPAGLTAAQLQDWLIPINAHYDQLTQSLAQEQATLQSQMKELIETEVRNNAERQTLADNYRKEVGLKTEEIRSDYETVNGIGFTDQQLATMEIGELTWLTNWRYEQDVAAGMPNPRGWPEGENSQLTRRQPLLHAVIEARVHQRLDPMSPSYDRSFSPTALDELSIFTVAGVTEEAFRSMTVREINTRMNKLHAVDPTRGWPPGENAANRSRLQNARAVARRLMGLRIDAFRSLGQDVKVQSLRATELATATTNQQFLEQASEVVSLMERQDVVFSQVYTKSRFQDERAVLYDTAVIPVTGGDYVQQERDFNGGARAPRAYYEFLDVLFDYQKDPQRGERFARISQLLPPDDLAQVLHDTPQLGLGALPVDFALIMHGLQLRLNSGGLTEREIRASMGAVIRHVRGRIMSQL